MSLPVLRDRSAAGAPPSWRPGSSLIANVFTIAALAGWWGYAQIVPPYLLPGPVAVVGRMADFFTDATLAGQLAISLMHVSAAIVLAFVIGCALAVVAHFLPPTRLLIDGLVTPFLNAFSGIGWLFLAILWFGLNSFTVIFAVTLILVPFTVINVRVGLQELDSDLLELSRSLSRSLYRRATKIILPLLIPYLFAALRTSFGVSWKVVLTAELFGGNAGVGYLLNVARQEFDTETIFAIILFILLFVATAETLLFRPVQRQLDRRLARA